MVRKEKRSEEFKKAQKKELARAYYEKNKDALRKKGRERKRWGHVSGPDVKLKIVRGNFTLSFD